MSDVPNAAPDAAAEQSSFEAALAAALAVQGEAEAQPPQADNQAAAEGGQSAQAQQTEAAAQSAAAAGTTEQSPPAPSAKELERVAALEAREAKLRDAEARAKDVERREADLAARELRTAKQWDAFVADPIGHIKSMRPELSSSEAAQVAEKLYFHAMGDKAPPEYRNKQEVQKLKTEVSSEVAELRAKLEESEARLVRQAAETEIKQYRAELRTGAATVADAPIVANLIQRNPARAEEMLFEVARQAAIESQKAGIDDPVVLTAAEAAAKLELILKAQRDELYGPPPVEAPHNGTKTPSPTISNRDASIQPNRAAPDPLDDKELRRAALKAAGLDIPVWD